MDRLGDFSVAERLPIAFGNGSDRRLHRYVLIGANSEDLAGLLAPVENRRLIRRAVGAHRRDFLALGHVALAGLHELEIARRRSRVSFAKLIAGDKAEFGDMPDHRHVALLAFVGVMRVAFLRHDLRRVDVECVGCAVVLP